MGTTSIILKFMLTTRTCLKGIGSPGHELFKCCPSPCEVDNSASPAKVQVLKLYWKTRTRFSLSQSEGDWQFEF